MVTMVRVMRCPLRVEGRERVRYSIIRIRRRTLPTRRSGRLACGRVMIQSLPDDQVYDHLVRVTKLWEEAELARYPSWVDMKDGTYPLFAKNLQ